MTTDYRAELQLLFDAAESFTEPALGHHRPWAAALDRARALLDQPEPQPVRPMAKELLPVAASAIAPYKDCGIALGQCEPEAERAMQVYGSELIARAVLAIATELERQ